MRASCERTTTGRSPSAVAAASASASAAAPRSNSPTSNSAFASSSRAPGRSRALGGHKLRHTREQAEQQPTDRRAPVRARRPRTGALPHTRQRGGLRVERAELGPVAVRLFEVVADELVELDRSTRAARASARSARAARRGSPSAAPRRRRPDQQMTEAEGVLPAERRLGANQLLTHERPSRPRRDSSGATRRRRRGGRPAPRRRRARARPLAARAGRGARRAAPGSSAARRHRPHHPRPHRDHLLDEQRVPLRGLGIRSRSSSASRRRARRSARPSPLAPAARAGRCVAFSLPPPQAGRNRAAPAAPCRAAGSARPG